MLATDSQDRIYAGTLGAGVFRSTEPTTAVDQALEEAPTTFSLAQNYPNPFNPATTIEFTVPAQTHVSLRIFDIKGRVVATPVDQPLGPGRYRITFEAKDLASGVYFYRLVADDNGVNRGFAETRKLTLLK